MLISCKYPQPEEMSELQWLNSAVPEDDVSKAIANGDYRFLGFRRNGVNIPAIEQACVKSNLDIRFIDGIPHATENYEQRKLIAIAEAYAQEYNLIMFNYLRGEKGFACNT